MRCGVMAPALESEFKRGEWLMSITSGKFDTSSGDRVMSACLVAGREECMYITRSPELVSNFPEVIDINHSPTVLICGHGGRDMTNISMVGVIHRSPETVRRGESSCLQHTLKLAFQAPELVSNFPEVIDINHSPTVLICGHGGRDMRCGVIVQGEDMRARRSLGRWLDRAMGSCSRVLRGCI
jgi:hypothetical protein